MKNANFIDMFGGSGLLSRCIKDIFKDWNIIFNDFDNYQRRLELIPITNKILQNIKEIVADNFVKNPIIHENAFNEPIIDKIKQILQQYDENMLDCIILSSNLLFCNNFCHNKKELLDKKIFYNRIVKERIS